MTCTHQRYKRNKGEYMTADNALKAMKAGAVVWIGRTVTHCEDCGEDLSRFNVVPVKSPGEYVKEFL